MRGQLRDQIRQMESQLSEDRGRTRYNSQQENNNNKKKDDDDAVNNNNEKSLKGKEYSSPARAAD